MRTLYLIHEDLSDFVCFCMFVCLLVCLFVSMFGLLIRDVPNEASEAVRLLQQTALMLRSF